MGVRYFRAHTLCIFQTLSIFAELLRVLFILFLQIPFSWRTFSYTILFVHLNWIKLILNIIKFVATICTGDSEPCSFSVALQYLWKLLCFWHTQTETSSKESLLSAPLVSNPLKVKWRLTAVWNCSSISFHPCVLLFSCFEKCPLEA